MFGYPHGYSTAVLAFRKKREEGRPPLAMIEALKLGFPVAAAQRLRGRNPHLQYTPPPLFWSLPEVCGLNCRKHGRFPAKDAAWFCGLGIVAFQPSAEPEAVMYLSVSFCQMIKAWTPASLGPISPVLASAEELNRSAAKQMSGWCMQSDV